MKLSILIWNNKIAKTERLLLSIFEEYNARDTEIILISEETDKLDYIVDKFENKILEGNLKIVLTTKSTPLEAYWYAADIARGEYLMFLESTSILKNRALERLLINIEVVEADVIETDIKFIGGMSMKYIINNDVKRNVLYDAQKTKNLYGYISPFLNNKIIKTNFFREVRNLVGSTPHEIAFSYKLLMNAETYLFVDQPLLITEVVDKFDIIKKLKQWEYLVRLLQRYSNWENIKEPIEYAYIRYLTQTMSSIIKAEKLTDEEYRWKIVIQERVYKLFPNWLENKMIMADENIKTQSWINSSEITAQRPVEVEKSKMMKATKRTTHGFAKAVKSIFK